jgi:hypothetical protein
MAEISSALPGAAQTKGGGGSEAQFCGDSKNKTSCFLPLSIVTDCSDLMSAIKSIVENQTQHELEDCMCAQLILEAVQEFVG